MHSCKIFLVEILIIYIIICLKLTTNGEENYIDLNNLIVITDFFSDSSSYFGYSFVLRNIANLSGTKKSLIFIGAPKGNYSNNSNTTQINESGVLWRCTIGHDPKDTCELLEIDPTKAGRKDCFPYRCPNEIKSNSWLGMTITSGKLNKDSNLVICAPQWKREETPLRGNFKFNGLCYWLPASVIESKPFNMSSMITIGYTTHRLFPFVNASLQTVKRFPVYSNGEVGFSSHLTDDGTLYLGAPGVNGWNGSIVRYKNDWSPTSLENERINRNDQTTFSKYNVLKTEFVEYFYHLEYFGYAVTSGIFIQNISNAIPSHLVAVGSPRGGIMNGTVLIFIYPEESQSTWLPDIVVHGNQFGSYFGSVLCATDLNGDGYDELIVGAPLQNLNLNKEILQEKNLNVENHTEHIHEQNNDSLHHLKFGDEGCIFVYSSKMELYKFSEPEFICGTKLTGSKFGSTIAALGDINHDGFNDLAVGAPYENEGVVYIFKGGANFGLSFDSREYYLKIFPSLLKIKLINFGISIYGGIDLDGNNTPDFAIGSHISQSVVIIRTRPSIKFEGRIDVYINETEVDRIPLETTDFMIRSCNRILFGPNHTTFNLNVKLIVDEDLKRFRIYQSFEGISYTTHDNTTIQYKIKLKFNETICLEWLTQTKTEFQTDKFHPQPLAISQELIYEEEFHDETNEDLIRHYHIFKNEIGQPETNISGPGFDNFCKYCPPKTILITTFRLPIAVDNCMNDDNPLCTPEINIHIFHLDGQKSITDNFIIGSENIYILRILVSNGENAETFYVPVINILWKSPPLPEVTPDCQFNLTETINKTSNHVSMQCNLGYTLQHNESKIIETRLYMHGMYAKIRKDELIFEVSASPLSKNLNIMNQTKFYLNVSLNANVEIFMVGSNESVAFVNDTFTNITHTFRVSLLGESPVENIRTIFWFPLKKKNEKKIIFISQNQGSTCREISKNKNDQLGKYTNIYQDQLIVMNLKRKHEEGMKQKYNITDMSDQLIVPNKLNLKPKKANLQLICNNDNDDDNCLHVACETWNIVPNHNIMLEFRLTVDNELAKEILRKNKQNTLEIQSIGIIQILDDEFKFSTAYTKIQDFSIAIESQISSWIYIVSGIIGIIILIIVIILLIKCGFFERPIRVKAELYPGVKPEEPKNWARWEYSEIYS